MHCYSSSVRNPCLISVGEEVLAIFLDGFFEASVEFDPLQIYHVIVLLICLLFIHFHSLHQLVDGFFFILAAVLRLITQILRLLNLWLEAWLSRSTLHRFQLLVSVLRFVGLFIAHRLHSATLLVRNIPVGNSLLLNILILLPFQLTAMPNNITLK